MENQKLDKLGIRVDYYDGAYGPTIRIDTHTVDELAKIKCVFLNLAESGPPAVNFLDLVDINATGLDQLILERVDRTRKLVKNLARKEDKPGRPSFIWSLPANGWRKCAGLIDGLIAYDLPAHQYLTQEGVDDALIELAFRESS